MRRLVHGEEGNAAVELAPVALVFLLFLGLAIAAGRITIAHMAVQAAARDAARQASIARTPGQAQAAARSSAEAALRADGLDCTPAVSVNTAGFAVPVGQPATGHRHRDLRGSPVGSDRGARDAGITDPDRDLCVGAGPLPGAVRQP